MQKFIFSVLWFSSALFAIDSPRVVLVVIDGVRAEEANSEKVMPYLQKMKKSGVYYENFQISNPHGVSLPAYADIFSGTRQSEITSNSYSGSELHSYAPTFFEAAFQQNKISEEEMALVSSWEKICPLAYSSVNPKPKMLLDCKGDMPVKYEESRADEYTHANLQAVLKNEKYKFIFVHFGDADEEAHAQAKIPKEKQNKTFYFEALTRADSYLEEIQKTLNTNSFYKDKSYLFVTTDHGRDTNWTDHGKCLLCETFKKSFFVASGPGLNATKSLMERDHRDIAPTIASVMGFQMPQSSGINLLKAPDLKAKQATVH